MANKAYSAELLAKVDEFIARERRNDRKAGAFADGEATKAYNNGTLEAWLAKVTA